jgi:hypothetical protein
MSSDLKLDVENHGWNMLNIMIICYSWWNCVVVAYTC